MKNYCIFPAIAMALSGAVAAQNVGIGTTTPVEKLQVAGNVKADTVKSNVVKITPNAAAGKILTSDAAGNANWENINTATAAGNIGFGVWGDCATNGNITEYNPVVNTSAALADEFGTSVSISGSYAIVGARYDDVSGNVDQGSASIYQYDGNNWVHIQKINGSGAAGDHFGTSVFISGNYAIVGAPGDNVGSNADQGSASIYQYNGSSWVLMQKLTGSGAASDHFGTSVSISDSYVIVGAPDDNIGANADQGSASIYQYNGSSWVLMQKITDAAGVADASFGISVSISGNYVIMGAYKDYVSTVERGSASIYQYNGSSWILMQKIASPGATGGFFGISVSISGNYAIVGASKDDVGSTVERGSARIYRYKDSNWELVQMINGFDSDAGDLFGISVFISGNYFIVGAAGDNVGNSSRGSASIYQKIGLGYQKLQYITDPGGLSNDYFGYSTAIDGATKRFITGAPYYIGNSGKAVFGKVN